MEYYAIATVGGDGRAAVPQRLAKRIPDLAGEDVIECWLLILEQGRYRVIFASDIKQNAILRQLKTFAEGGISADKREATEPLPATETVLVARLLSATISPKSSSGIWRLAIPTDLPEPTRLERVAFLVSGQSLEVWSIARLSVALAVPLKEALSEWT